MEVNKIKFNVMATNSNHDHARAVEEALNKILLHYPNAVIECKSGQGYDIRTSSDENETFYLGVVKMKYSENSQPYCAVSATKWKFAVEHYNQYFFDIACEKADGTFDCTYYNVIEFWKMSSKPTCQLYCHRDKAEHHPSLNTKLPNCTLEKTKMAAISKSVKALINFRNSFK